MTQDSTRFQDGLPTTDDQPAVTSTVAEMTGLDRQTGFADTGKPRWIHLLFPWGFGLKGGPQRSAEQMATPVPPTHSADGGKKAKDDDFH